jgi:hypothetical protein
MLSEAAKLAPLAPKRKLVSQVLAARERSAMEAIVKAIARTPGVACPDLVDRLKPQSRLGSCRYNQVHRGLFLPLFRELAGNQVIHGYRRDSGHNRQDGAHRVERIARH